MADKLRPTGARPANALGASAWMFGTALSFVLMMVAVRELASTMSAFQILSFRSQIGIPIMCVVAAYLGFHRVRTPRMGMQIGRNVVHFGGQFCWVIGISLLPLAHVTALEFTMPMWTALIAILFLGERARSHRILALAIGIAGTLVILRPGLEIVTEGALVILFGAILYATSNAMVKALTAHDAPWVIVFWTQFIQLPLALIPALFWFDWVTPVWQDAPWLLAMGLTGMSAHFCMARAFQLADATVCMPIDFIRLPLTALVGWLFYTETVSIWVVVGAVMIFAGNYYSVWRETRSEAA